jgi:hypothetical protein
MDRRRRPSGSAVPKTGPITVADWAKEWLESRRAKNLVIVDDYKGRLDNHRCDVGDVQAALLACIETRLQSQEDDHDIAAALAGLRRGGDQPFLLLG